jgi:hypothetical protein
VKKGTKKGQKTVTKEKPVKEKSKCSDCNKMIGQKEHLNCHNCDNSNRVECLKSVDRTRILQFQSGQEKFICNQCISSVDSNTLDMITLEETVDEETRETNQPDTEKELLLKKLEEREFELTEEKSKNEVLKEALDTIKALKMSLESKLESSSMNNVTLHDEKNRSNRNKAHCRKIKE